MRKILLVVYAIALTLAMVIMCAGINYTINQLPYNWQYVYGIAAFAICSYIAYKIMEK